jgi:hypothetical protein
MKPIVLLALETVLSMCLDHCKSSSLLYRPFNSQIDSDLLQKDLSALEKWEEEWQMSFLPQKCTIIRIATNQRHVREYFFLGRLHSI